MHTQKVEYAAPFGAGSAAKAYPADAEPMQSRGCNLPSQASKIRAAAADANRFIA